MKYSVLLVALLSASSLFAVDHVQAIDTKVIQQTNADLQKAIVEANQAKEETKRAKAELAQIKAQRDQEATAVAEILKQNQTIHISVIGQGVAPMNTASPAQAYALAKRAAIADAYRAIAEKVKGVRVEGQDLIKNMMVKRSTIRTSVRAMVKNANVVETTFKEGLCEVEMEIIISHSDFHL